MCFGTQGQDTSGWPLTTYSSECKSVETPSTTRCSTWYSRVIRSHVSKNGMEYFQNDSDKPGT